MKQSLTLLGVVLVGVVVFAQQPAPNPEMAAALAKQAGIEKDAPRLQITEEILPLVVPGHTIGEAVGVAKNSKGHLFVFTRSGATGPAKGATASQLFEFDPGLKFVKQWGPDNYAASFAHTVRVDKDDNVWMVDEGSNMVVKFNPEGRVILVVGRKPEAIDYLERYHRGRPQGDGDAAGEERRVQPPDRRHLGHRGQHLRRRRLQQLTPGQDVEGRHVGRRGRRARRGAEPVQHARTASPTTPRATSTSPIAATAGSRCSIR